MLLLRRINIFFAGFGHKLQGAAHCRSRTYAFKAFTFDCNTGQLMRNGRKVRIRPQTAQVLSILLERAGALVTREDLRQLLWRDEHVEDYEHAISRAISQLRFILRDDSQAPHFIETIPKKGYRFCGQPELIDPAMSAEVSSADRGSLSTETGLRVHVRKLLWIAGVLLVLGLLTGFLVLHSRRQNRPSPTYTHIGVVPFKVEGPDTGHLAERFSLDLTDALSRLPSVRVHTVHLVPGADRNFVNVRTLVENLKVDVLLLGKFSLNGERCTLELEMLRGSDGSHLAKFRYGGTKGELGEIRAQIQREILRRLVLNDDASKRNTNGTTNPRAYEAYLRARQDWAQQTPESLNKALEAFRTAVAEDPNFATAYSAMAHLYVVMSDRKLIPRDEGYRKARETAELALRLNPSRAEAHFVLGLVSVYQESNVAVGEKEFREAINLDTTEPLYRLCLAEVLYEQGRFDEALKEIESARAVEPLWPPVLMTEIAVAGSARQLERAEAVAQKLISLMPNSPPAHAQRAWLLWNSRRYSEAIAEWRQAALLQNDTSRVKLEDQGLRAFRKGGVRAYARVRLEAIENGEAAKYTVEDFFPPVWYAYAGEEEKALNALEEMMSEHDPAILQAAIDPAYTSLHQNPRFLALLARMRLNLPHSFPK